MIIKLSPQRRGGNLAITKNGDVLTINGIDYDFSPLPDGAILPAEAVGCEFVIGAVERINGEISIKFLFPIPENYSQEQAFPADLIDVQDGDVELPKPLEIVTTVMEEVA